MMNVVCGLVLVSKLSAYLSKQLFWRWQGYPMKAERTQELSCGRGKRGKV